MSANHELHTNANKLEEMTMNAEKISVSGDETVLEEVEKFTQLGTTASEDCSPEEEINARLP